MAEKRDIQFVRRAFRKLLDQFPDAFAAVLEELLKAGSDWKRQLPPLRRAKIDEMNLLLLLADYRNAREHLGWKRREFLERCAGGGYDCSNVYFSGKWHDEETIKTYLGRAERLVKQNKAFADEIKYFQFVLTRLGAGCMKRGETGKSSSP
jgi:hypothetical protein